MEADRLGAASVAIRRYAYPAAPPEYGRGALPRPDATGCGGGVLMMGLRVDCERAPDNPKDGPYAHPTPDR